MDVREIALHLEQNPKKIVEEIKKRECVLNDLIKPCPDLKELESFVVSHYWSDSDSVNVFLVSGTVHPDYNNGISWIDLILYGKRMPLNLRLLKENPDYYFETRKKEPVIHYIKINDDIFVGRDGNHRTAIAKVLFYYTGYTVLHGIEFEEYRVDLELKKRFENLKNLLTARAPYVEARILRKCVKREDTQAWKKDYFELSVELINHRNRKRVLIYPEELNDVLKEFENFSWWKRFFGFSKSKISSLMF